MGKYLYYKTSVSETARMFLYILTFLYDSILSIIYDENNCKHLQIWGVNNPQNESQIFADF